LQGPLGQSFALKSHLQMPAIGRVRNGSAFDSESA